MSSRPRARKYLRQQTNLFSFFAYFSYKNLLADYHILTKILGRILRVVRHSYESRQHSDHRVIFHRRLACPKDKCQRLLMARPLGFGRFSKQYKSDQHFRPMTRVLIMLNNGTAGKFDASGTIDCARHKDRMLARGLRVGFNMAVIGSTLFFGRMTERHDTKSSMFKTTVRDRT